jgi:hypothetical protein
LIKNITEPFGSFKTDEETFTSYLRSAFEEEGWTYKMDGTSENKFQDIYRNVARYSKVFFSLERYCKTTVWCVILNAEEVIQL